MGFRIVTKCCPPVNCCPPECDHVTDAPPRPTSRVHRGHEQSSPGAATGAGGGYLSRARYRKDPFPDGHHELDVRCSIDAIGERGNVCHLWTTGLPFGAAVTNSSDTPEVLLVQRHHGPIN
jgi:hypothetical protein